MSSLHAGRPFAALAIPPPGLYLIANGSRGYGLVGLLLWTATSNQLFDSPFPGKGLEAMRQPGTPAGTAGLT